MPLQDEFSLHQEIKAKLEEAGWLNGNELLKFKENELVENFYFPKFLEKKVKEINKELFLNLTPSEEKDVLDFIHNELRNATEERILRYIKYGIPVTINNETRIVWLIDYSNRKNTFFYLHEAKFRGSLENTKPDFTLFINGIPVVIIEAKSESIPYSHSIALNQIRRYEVYSPELFRFVQFGVAYGDEKYYSPTLPNWEKRIKDLPAFNWGVEEYENGKKISKDNIFDLLIPGRLLEFLKYFIFFLKPKEGENRKLIARQNQYRATVKAISRIKEYMSNLKKNRGLIWHWQGSGKTYTMFFIANYFLDLYYGTNPLVFFIVDREDLEDQHERMLKAVQDEKFKTLFEKVESIKRLGEIIKVAKESEMSANIIARGVYLTTIQKFQRKKENSESLNEENEEATKELYTLLLRLGESYLNHLKNANYEEYFKHIQSLKDLDEKACEKYLLELGGVRKKNILFLIDEAHRSQYGLLSAMRKISFPESIAFGFTGTPIFKNEKNTFLEFSYPDQGEYYLDVYFIEDSIRDRFTLPIVHHVVKEGEVKAEGVRIKLTEEEIAGFIKEYMKKKGRIEELLDAEISKKEIEKHITKAKVILLNKKRIEKLAEYITERIEKDTENFKYKAMVVAVNRVGCVRYKRALDKYLIKKFGDKAKSWTEIVMTYSYNDTEPEIVEYREELINRRKNNDLKRINFEIQNDFLEKENPKILIVTDMLLTGFDAPILKVMYLDKPLYEHRLLQAIARVNRPYLDKEFGLIVDSFGLMEHLVKTMAIYNLLAEEEIRKDFEMNLMKSAEQKFVEFENKFRQLKEELKNLKLNEEGVGIDIEMVKTSFKKGINKEQIETRISMIAMYLTEDKSFSAKIVRVINDIKALLKTYSALGAYPQRVVYVEDIEALAYIYYKLRRIMSGSRKKPGKEFWNELLKYIHNRTVIEDFREVGKAQLSPESLEALIKDLTDEEEIRKKIINEVADFYFNLRASLVKKQHDPVYRQILERLEKLRFEWITRAIGTKTFLARLKAIEEEWKEYERKIYGKSETERILETLSHYIEQKTKIKVQLSNTKEVIKRILSNAKIKMFTPEHKRKIKTEMLKDLFLARINEKQAKELVEELTEEYLKEELKRLWRS